LPELRITWTTIQTTRDSLDIENEAWQRICEITLEILDKK
jgi:hypothetical protein